MNLRHLGDAIDHWKGCVLELLQADVRVVPMFADEDVASAWTPQRRRLYAQLLRVDEDHILQGDVRFTETAREAYFTAVGKFGDSDLFVDPDAGVAPPSGGDARHIRPADIATLLPAASNRMILIYQHSTREDNWIAASVERVVEDQRLDGCSAFAYWSGSASILFVSRRRDRLEMARSILAEFVGELPIQRVSDVNS